MSKSRQPVFQKPELPAFLKRIHESHNEEARAQECPMTDAPVLEDQLPVVINARSEDDLDKVKELEGMDVVKAQSGSLPEEQSGKRGTTASLGSSATKLLAVKRQRLLQSTERHDRLDGSGNEGNVPTESPVDTRKRRGQEGRRGKRKKMLV